MPQIECTGLCVGYDSKVIADNLNFSVSAGDYLCITGENGSGKSTLMKTLLGLLAPLGGQLEFGEGVSGNEIGYVPQQSPVRQDFPASVREVVTSGCLARTGILPFRSRERRALADDAMEKMHIAALADRCYRELSGGQRQRVLLARALCATRKIILLDEPTSGLDPAVSAEMYRLIRSLNRDDGVTVIMITHDISAALKYADNILCLDREVFFGTRDEYLKSHGGIPAPDGDNPSEAE